MSLAWPRIFERIGGPNVIAPTSRTARRSRSRRALVARAADASRHALTAAPTCRRSTAPRARVVVRSTPGRSTKTGKRSQIGSLLRQQRASRAPCPDRPAPGRACAERERHLRLRRVGRDVDQPAVAENVDARVDERRAVPDVNPFESAGDQARLVERLAGAVVHRDLGRPAPVVEDDVAAPCTGSARRSRVRASRRRTCARCSVHGARLRAAACGEERRKHAEDPPTERPGSQEYRKRYPPQGSDSFRWTRASAASRANRQPRARRRRAPPRRP